MNAFGPSTGCSQTTSRPASASVAARSRVVPDCPRNEPATVISPRSRTARKPSRDQAAFVAPRSRTTQWTLATFR